MATFAGHYVEALIDLEGDALISTPVRIYAADSATLVTLYTDRGKGTNAANPTVTSATGTLEFYAEPGEYDGAAVIGGIEQGRFPIVVDPDAAGEIIAQVAAHTAATDPHADRAAASAALAAHGADTTLHGGTAIAGHLAASNPHPEYATDADLTGHVGAADPHGDRAAATTALGTHAALEVTAHGGIVADDDARLTDTRTPTDGTVTNAKVNAGAAIALSKLAVDPLARGNHTGTQAAATVSDFDTQVRTSRLDQLAAPTGSVGMNSQKLTGLGTPTGDGDAATKAYADGIASGYHALTAVQAASTANLTLSGEQTIDAILTSADRVLVKNQTAPAENGVYVTAAGAWSRATDADSSAELVGAQVFVEGGTVNGLTSWTQQTPATITVGSTAVVWAQSGAASQTIAGSGLSKSGNTIDVGATDSTITVGVDSIKVATGGITGAEIAASIKDPAAATPGLRTLGTSATSAAAGNDGRLSDSRAPSGSAGGSLAGTFPNPTIAAGAVGGTEVAAAIKDPAAGTAGLRTLGTGAAQAAAGNDARLSDTRTPTDNTVSTAKLVNGAVTAAKVAADVATQAELDAHAADAGLHGGGSGGGSNTLNSIYNVKDPAYGALGDNATNDAPAIQAAIDAASTAGGGVVLFPRGNYRIGSTLTWKVGVCLEGVHGGTTGADSFPNIIWAGASGGTMITTDTLSANRGFKTMKRLRIVGTIGTAGGNVAAIGVRFTDRIDQFTSITEVQIQRVNGVALQCDKGGINFEVRQFRVDSVRDWAIKWTQLDTSDRLSVRDFTYDNGAWTTDPTGVPGGGGFFLHDGTAMGINAQLHLAMSSAKLEVNKNLNANLHGQSISATIKTIPNPAITGDKTFFEGYFEDIWTAPGGGITVSETVNPTFQVSPEDDFIKLVLVNCRKFTVAGIPGYRDHILTGSQRYLTHTAINPVKPRMSTSPSSQESAAIEVHGTLNVQDFAFLAKSASPVVQSTGADFPAGTILYKATILENPANVSPAGAKQWQQVLNNSTTGTLSGVTVTRTTANQGTVSSLANLRVGHWITVEGNSYEITARIPGTSTIEVFPNWASAAAGVAVAYTAPTFRTLDLSGSGGGGGGAPTGPAGGDLTGTYPDPVIASGAVSNAEIATGAGISRSKLDFGAGLVDADVASGAAISETKLNLASDAAAITPSRRTLGAGALQAAAGNHAHGGGGGGASYTGLVNVKDAPYSAAGNGATLDHVAFQAAMDAASAAGGGVVLVPPGTYLIGATLQLPHKVSLVGYAGESTTNVVTGRNATTLKLANGVNAALLTNKSDGPAFGGDTVQHSLLQGIHFEGNSANNTVAANTGVVALGNIITMVIRDITIIDGDQACLSMASTNSCFIENSWFIDPAAGPCVYWTSVGDSMLRGCTLGRGQTHGLHMVASQYNLVVGNFSYNHDTTTGGCYYLSGTSTVGNVLSNNRADDNQGHGIVLHAAARNTITGNVCSRNGTGVGAGIYLTTSGGTGAKNNAITGNQFGNSISSETKQDWGVLAETDCIGNTFTGNTLHNNTLGPVSLVGTSATGNTWVGNVGVADQFQLAPRWISTLEQTTVGAAGGASALPATPTKFLRVTDSSGASLVIPAYAAS